MAKRGRRANHYITADGETIVGLARRPADGRWRIIGTRITFTEPDEKLALHKFRMYQARQEKSVMKFTQPLSVKDLQDDESEFWKKQKEIVIRIDPEGEMFSVQEVPDEVLWGQLRNFILTKPHLAAQKLGIPEIAYLQELPLPQPSPTLEEIGNLYQSKARITEHERLKSRLFWKEFTRHVQVKTV